MFSLIPPQDRRSVRRMPRTVSVVLAAALAMLSFAAPVRAATDASDVVVEVLDAASGVSIGLARVLLPGEAGAIGYTDADGRARFESVATGSYRASVVKRGYIAARSPLFDVTAHRTTNVRVRLQKAGTLKQIGSVSVSSSPARASREVGQDDALRFLDGSLRDALGDLPGVTSAGDGLMVDGNDASQTGTSIDGVPIPGVGGSLGDRGINADLFGGASVSSGAANGALGGSVGFRTLQPTRFAQQSATLQYGSDNASSALVLARGSVRNLGYVVEHAVRGRTSPFTGLTFTDESGFTYRHDGDRLLSGDLAKLRWAPSIAQTLTFTATQTGSQNGIVCSQLTALFPCGFGPSAFGRGRSGLMTLAENATIGTTTVSIAGFVSGSQNSTAESQRSLAGIAAPQSSDFRTLARGFSLGIQLPAGDRHDVSLSAQSYGLSFTGSTTTVAGTFPLAQQTTFHGASVSDRWHPDQRVTVTGRAGVNGGNGSSAFASSFGVRWQPNRAVAYDVAASAGDAGAGLVVSGTAVPDPRSLTFDCANGLAYGSVPSANAAHQRSSALRASVERSGRRGRVALTAWTARLTAAPVLTAADATAGLPPGYLAAVGALGSSPFVCGSPSIGSVAFTSFQPADQISRGATLAGTLELGKVVIAGFATVQSRFVTNATPTTAALTPVGTQVPDAPLHRAGVVATTKLGKSVDLLANVSYTAANNPNRLRAYSVFNAGFAAPLREGSLALVGTNLGNVHPGPFVPFADVAAFARAGAAPLALPATPLGTRAVALTYTVRVGRLGATGSGAGTADAGAEPGGEGRAVEIRIRVSPLREGPHPDALQIDPDNDACTPAAARVAQPVMDAVGRIAAAAERAKTAGRYPTVVPGGSATVNGSALTYTPYDGGARFVVTVAGSIQSAAAFINCARLSAATPEDREKYHLYFPASNDQRGFFIAYGPTVGLYMIPPQMVERGMTRAAASLESEPSAPPAAPFALRAECPSSSKPIADAVVAAVRAAREAQRSGAPVPPADVAEITARGTAARGWIEIEQRDPISQVAALQCLHVAGVARARLHAEGILDERRPGALGFAERFGLYVIARPQPPGSPSDAPAPAHP